jgi:prepilin-type N-terminal cleavage/methylation domain-containing protein
MKKLITKIEKALHKKATGEEGFTLIELIVVITVLGTLATLLIPKVLGVKDRAETEIDAANEKIIRNALERYYAKEGSYPNADTGDKLPKEELKDFLDLDDKDIQKWIYENTSNTNDSYTLKKKSSQ